MSSADNDSAPSAAATAAASTARPAAPCLGVAVAAFPSMARDRAWEQPTVLDLLDLAEAAIRRLEAIAWLIAEAGARGARSPSTREAAGVAEILEDVAVSLRVVVARMGRSQGLGQ